MMLWSYLDMKIKIKADKQHNNLMAIDGIHIDYQVFGRARLCPRSSYILSSNVPFPKSYHPLSLYVTYFVEPLQLPQSFGKVGVLGNCGHSEVTAEEAFRGKDTRSLEGTTALVERSGVLF